MTTGVEGLTSQGLPSALANELAGAADALTATAGGTQTTSTELTSFISRFSTVATAGDSTLLPYSRIGSIYVIANGSGTKYMTVFGKGSDTVNGVAGATGFQLPPGKVAFFIAPAAGKWVVNLSA